MAHHVKERVILAPNPSPLTGPGTNSFLLGDRRLAVIDPGPNDSGHVQAIMDAAGTGQITHIFVTHAHLDHSGAAVALSRSTGAPILAFGDATAGRSPAMERAVAAGLQGGGEGVDTGFSPDLTMRDGDVIATDEWSLRAIHTPGHMGNHLSFATAGAAPSIYCGDVVMGWSSTLISPPDGDLADYFRSLARLRSEGARRLLPAHGEPILNVTARLDELATHRRARTAQIMAALRDGDTPETLAARIYDVPPTLLPAAARNVLAHLLALADLGAVRFDEGIWRPV
ncbi:MAG: MBL fold metallo-hydrolase [Paracoccus denitrificans]|nr:MAG: MBL fold metallo-hydrolase [Paracoccus denitrificans]PZO84739.1 MAG: MBL fold metallo-hydrolase [Paracoccus denitrificans]